MPRRNLGQIGRKLAAGAPEIDLEGERVLPRAVVGDPLQRRVRDETTIPVVFALDLGCRESRRQRAARYRVLRADRVRRRVEIDEVTGADVHRTDAEAHLAGIDPIEVDESLERCLEKL